MYLKYNKMKILCHLGLKPWEKGMSSELRTLFFDLLFQGMKTVQDNEQGQRLLNQAVHILFSSYLLQISYL